MEITSTHASICIAWPHTLEDLDVAALVLSERALRRRLERYAMVQPQRDLTEDDAVVLDFEIVRRP
jgi:hypothetical protein